MEKILIVLLLILMLLFFTLFLMQRIIIKSAEKQLRYIYKNPDMNLRLKLSMPNKGMEHFLGIINEYLELFQKEHIHHDREEKKLKQEIANVSHDLRTPLTSIMGYMSILTDENLSDEDRKEYLNIVRKKGEMMKTLLESFYELSSVEAKDYSMHKEEVYLYSILCDIILAFYQDFERKNIEVQLDLQENIAVIMLDKHAIVRVINNLIQNALRYAKSWAKISLKQEDGKLCLTFSNDTDLLKPSDMEHLFERTYTADNSRRNGQTGLGLSITKKLVELQGGEISAELKDEVFFIRIKCKFL